MQYNINKIWILLILFVIFITAPFFIKADESTSTDFKMLDSVLVPAEFSESADYQLHGTISQISIGTSTVGDFLLRGGFLYFPFVSLPVVSASAGDAQVALSWTAAVGALGWTVSGYNVGQATVSGGPYNYTSVGNVTNSTRSGLANGSTYYFVIRAEDTFGNSIATSTEVSATPEGEEEPPPGGGGGSYITPEPLIKPPPLIDEEFIPRECPITGDLSGECRVNLVDFSILLYWFGRSDWPTRIDLSGDGKIDIRDFSIMAYYWTG